MSTRSGLTSVSELEQWLNGNSRRYAAYSDSKPISRKFVRRKHQRTVQYIGYRMLGGFVLFCFVLSPQILRFKLKLIFLLIVIVVYLYSGIMGRVTLTHKHQKCTNSPFI